MQSNCQLNKLATYKWRKANPRKYYECNRKYTENWVKNNHDRYREMNNRASARSYQWKKITTIFRHILLD